jgi:hypothetical protein
VGQSLNLALEIFGLAAGVALVVSLATAWTARRVTPARWSGHFIAPCAVAIAFVAGYALLPRDWAGWEPEANQPWTWLPYVGLLAAVFAAAFPPGARSQAWRLVLIVVALIAAVYLTPNWPVFGLARQHVRWVLVAYLLLVGMPLQYLPTRVADAGLLAAMSAAAAMSAVASGAMVSTRLAQLAAIATGALAGSWIVGLLSAKRRGLPAAGVIPVYMVLVGGIAWIACVEPEPAKMGLLVIPFVPALVSMFRALVRRPGAPTAG